MPPPLDAEQDCLHGHSKMMPGDKKSGTTGIHVISSLGGPSLTVILQLLPGHPLPQTPHSLGSALPSLATTSPQPCGCCTTGCSDSQPSQNLPLTVSCTAPVMGFRVPASVTRGCFLQSMAVRDSRERFLFLPPSCPSSKTTS